MLAIHRRIIKSLQTYCPGIKADLVRETRHVVMDFSYHGKTYRAAIAKSPKNPDHCVSNVCAEVCRGLGVVRGK